MSFIQVDAGNARIVYLFEKLLQICAAFVPHPCLGEQTACGSALEDADAEINILAKTHVRESVQLSVQRGLYAHVERSGIKLVHFLFSAAYTTGGKKAGHAVIDGFLYGRKGLMRTVRPAESGTGVCGKFLLYLFKISGRQHTVAVKHNQVFALTALRSVVATLSRPGIRFLKIFQIKMFGIFLHHIGTSDRRAVLNHNHLHVLIGLQGNALQQFIHLIRAVIYRYYQ